LDSLYRCVSEARYYCRDGIWGEGLTPKEKKYIYSRLQEIDRIIKDLDMIYKRLKR